MQAKRFVRSLFLIAVFAVTGASGGETLPTPRSIILSAGQEQAAQPVILAARRYAAFWNTGEARYAEAALAQNFVDRTLPSGRRQGAKGVLEASKNFRAAIPDLKAEIAALAGRGVSCSEVEEARWGSMTRIRLPGGGEIGLYQPNHPSPLAPPGR